MPFSVEEEEALFHEILKTTVEPQLNALVDRIKNLEYLCRAGDKGKIVKKNDSDETNLKDRLN